MNLSKKNVLITGADGFIGSHLVECLAKYGCNIKAFVCYNSFNNYGWLENLPRKVLHSIEIINGDIRDSDRVAQAIKGSNIIFHLAALIAIPYSYYSPRSYIDTNVTGTLNVLQAAKDSNVEKILVTSTSEVYGSAQYVPIDEKHPLQGQSPYSASKIGADKIAEAFYRSFDAPVVTVRPFNTYGPRQSARAVIPSIITQLISGQQEVMLGDLNTKRDFTYVEDTVRGFVELAKTDEAVGKVVNIATSIEYSIEDITNILISTINPNAKIVRDSSRIRPKNSEVYRLLGDNSLIKELTPWRTTIDMQTGLLKTIKWFSNPKNLLAYKEKIYNI